MKNFGICKLTGRKGALVKAHLLPKALTRPERRGNHFIQAGEDQRPVRRHSSWFDPLLVVQEGENILGRYDDAGIKELRRLQLIWSSWNGATAYPGPDMEPYPSESMLGMGLRVIQDANREVLRLFFLSLLWRAAATNLMEFSEVQLPADELETLRMLVLQGVTGAADFYPVVITQIMTRGIAHNLSPFALDNYLDIGHGRRFRLSAFRFYFDGLVVHFHRKESDLSVRGAEPLIVGLDHRLALQGIPAEHSFEMINLLRCHDEAHLQFPKTMAKLDPIRVANEQMRVARYESLTGQNHPWLIKRE